MKLLFTLLIFILLLVGIKKKIDIRVSFMGLSFLIMCFLAITTGPVLGEDTTGSAVVDMFTYFISFLTNNIGPSALGIVMVFALVEVLSQLKATDMLAYLISIPVQKIKAPFLMAGIVAAIGGLLRCPINAGPSLAALMIGIFFPILLSIGVSRETAAASMLVFGVWAFGPADPSCLTAAKVMGIEVVPALWFSKVQLPFVGYSLVILIAMFIISSKWFDRKRSSDVEESGERPVITRPDCPTIYAILPFLPLVLMIVFSPLVLPSFAMDTSTACFVSLVITLLVALIANRGKLPVQKLFLTFFKAIGDNIAGVGLIVVFGMFFATLMSRVGGLTIVANALVNLRLPSMLTVMALCVFTALIGMVMGSFYGSLSIGLSLASSFVAVCGLEESVLCYMVLTAVFCGCCCSPANATPQLIAQKTGVDVMTVVKRCIPAIWTMLICDVIITCLVF